MEKCLIEELVEEKEKNMEEDEEEKAGEEGGEEKNGNIGEQGQVNFFLRTTIQKVCFLISRKIIF